MPIDRFLEHRILSADPVELIQILYEHAIRLVGEARSALARGDIVARSKAISRTIGILGELEGSLDREAGGAISHNLAALYQYMRNRLTLANVNQSDSLLAEVQSLMQTLSEGWRAGTPKPIEEFGGGGVGAPGSQMEGPGNAQFLPEPAAVNVDHSWTA